MGVRRGSFEKLRLDNPAKRRDTITANIPTISGIGTPLRILAKDVRASQQADAILYTGVAEGIHKVCNGIAAAIGAYEGFSGEAGSAQNALDTYKSGVESGSIQFDQVKYNSLVNAQQTASSNVNWFSSFRKAWGGGTGEKSTLDSNEVNELFSGWGAKYAEEAIQKQAAAQNEAAERLNKSSNEDDDDDEMQRYNLGL